MPDLQVQAGDKLPAIQNAAKTIGNAITAFIGGGAVTLAVLLAPDSVDPYIVSIGGFLTLAAGVLVTWGTRNEATTDLTIHQ